MNAPAASPEHSLGEVHCADCNGTHEVTVSDNGTLMTTDQCRPRRPRRYHMHCMDCLRAYAHSPVEGSTGLCLPCLRIREDSQLKEVKRCLK